MGMSLAWSIGELDCDLTGWRGWNCFRISSGADFLSRPCASSSHALWLRRVGAKYRVLSGVLGVQSGMLGPCASRTVWGL